MRLLALPTTLTRRQNLIRSPLLFLLATTTLLPTHLYPTPAHALSTKPMLPQKIVVVGGGIQGSSVAHHLAKHPSSTPTSSITILESQKIANAASGKGGGFMARSWGDGSPTQTLHTLSFDMYESLSKELNVKTYRKLPVLSVRPGKGGGGGKKTKGQIAEVMPGWLDGNVGGVSPLGWGDDTAQVTPKEFTQKLIEGAVAGKVSVTKGTCIGVVTTSDGDDGGKKVSGVRYERDGKEEVLECDAVVVSAGPWSCAAEDWFDSAVKLPMEGVKSTSVVWKAMDEGRSVDATALFCGEDHRFGTHLEVYPRPDNTIYMCGIGGSDYIPTEDLKKGAFREVIDANPTRVDAAAAAFREMSESYRAEGELETTQACMRPCPPDAMPYMGAIPGYEGAYVNAGHNCWGIAWAPACGKAMAELILEGESKCVDLTPFDPARFTPVKGRGSRGRKRRGVNVGEQW